MAHHIKIQIAGVSSLEVSMRLIELGVDGLGFTLRLVSGIHDGLTEDKAKQNSAEKELHRQINTLESDKKAFHETIKQANKEKRDQDSTGEELRSQINKIETDNSKLQDTIAEQQTKQSDQKSAIKTLQSEIERLKKGNDELHKTIDE